MLRVTAFAADGRGAYRAAVARAAAAAAAGLQPGTERQRERQLVALAGRARPPTDPDDDGRRFDDYLIHFEAGQRRYISLEGDGFDALVQVLRAGRARRASARDLDQDDDAGAGLNSLLAFAPEEAGDYIVRVTSFGDGSGAYRLWVSE